MLLDLGHGSFQRIFARRAPEDIAAVIVSHLHPDHFIDLVPLRHYLRYYLEPPRRVRVLGPGELAARLDALHDEPGFTAGALDTEADRPGTAPDRRPRGRGATRGPHGRQLRDPGRARRARRRRASCTAATAGAPTTCAPLIRPGDTLLAEVSFGPGPVPRGAPPRRAGRRSPGGVDAASAGCCSPTSRWASTRTRPSASVSAGYDGPVVVGLAGDAARPLTA